MYGDLILYDKELPETLLDNNPEHISCLKETQGEKLQYTCDCDKI